MLNGVDLRFVAGGMYPFRYRVAVRNDAGELQPLATAERVRIERRSPLRMIFKELYEHI